MKQLVILAAVLLSPLFVTTIVSAQDNRLNVPIDPAVREIVAPQQRSFFDSEMGRWLKYGWWGIPGILILIFVAKAIDAFFREASPPPEIPFLKVPSREPSCDGTTAENEEASARPPEQSVPQTPLGEAFRSACRPRGSITRGNTNQEPPENEP
jgi:hypothetical protein